MTDWTLVSAVLGAGLLLGGFFLLLLGRRGAPTAAEQPADSLRDLRAERDLLVARLRELDADPRDAQTVAAERRELELRAARVLRDLDAAQKLQEKAPAAEAPAASSSALRGFAWGLGSAAFLAALLFLAMRGSQDRLPGASPTGNTFGAEHPSTAEAPDPELMALIQRAEQDPENTDARLDVIQVLLARERYVDAWPFIQQLAPILPDSPRRLLYEATVREAMGQWAESRALLERALEGDPRLAEAWVRRGLVSFELEDYETAISSWEEALRIRPDGSSVLEPVIAEARRRMEGGAAAPAREPAQAAAEEDAVRIQVELSEEARARAGEGGFLFLTARPAGVRAGPPIAAKRVPVAGFPMEISLGPSDTMMGQPFPASARIEARLDRDGDAQTQDPDDPRAAADPVLPGASLRLVLE